mmetsp:Transcript_37925/g.79949  ORF Transcript_37925/g.79949 Transcript_37925/m.79949 type:complete len:114 (+) Transcript_37925:683-1024(+)
MAASFELRICVLKASRESFFFSASPALDPEEGAPCADDGDEAGLFPRNFPRDDDGVSGADGGEDVEGAERNLPRRGAGVAMAISCVTTYALGGRPYLLFALNESRRYDLQGND